mgnify:CR=1 FL=1
MTERRSKSRSISSISCGVVCYETPHAQLRELLQSLLISIWRLQAIQPAISTTIFVIDNSTNESDLKLVCAEQQELLKIESIKIRYVGGHGNIGYGAAQNLAIASTNSDLHLILNPDVIVEAGALEESIKVFSSNPSVVLLSPRAQNDKGQKQYLCKRFPSVLTLLVRGFMPKYLQGLFKIRLGHYEMREIPEAGVTEDIPLISGCFMFSNTSLLRDIGGFDEGYFLYFEDFDLSVRLSRLGQIVHAPGVRIVHSGGGASRKGLKHVGYFFKSGIRFFNKYGWRFF